MAKRRRYLLTIYQHMYQPTFKPADWKDSMMVPTDVDGKYWLDMVSPLSYDRLKQALTDYFEEDIYDLDVRKTGSYNFSTRNFSKEYLPAGCCSTELVENKITNIYYFKLDRLDEVILSHLGNGTDQELEYYRSELINTD